MPSDIYSGLRSGAQNAASAETPRDRSPVESAMVEMDNAQSEVEAVIEQLSNRLQSILRPSQPSPDLPGKGRASMEAKLPELIMNHADREMSQARLLRDLVSRLAI